MNNKKVAIVSCYFYPNYGSQLQSFATQKILDQMGIENETICIDGITDQLDRSKKKYYASKVFNFDVIKDKSGYIINRLRCKMDKELGKNFAIRKKKRNEFANSMFRLTKTCNSFEELSKMCEDYSDVLLGSDQLWLPSNIEAGYYTLEFVPDNINKIAYAPSFGVSKLPPKQEERAKHFLPRIDHIAVREKSGQKLIKDLTGRDVPCVCDPTLLFDGAEWSKEATDIKRDEDYIFCYFLGSNPLHRDFANRLAKKTGCKIVTLKYCDIFVKNDKNFGDEAPFDIGPKEFLGLIKNAKYVCTDSFHGSVFSVQFHKQFFAFRRFAQKSVQSTNSRLDSLFNSCGIENRILSGEENIDDVLKEQIDYSEVDQRLADYRKFSKQYLSDALGVNNND